MNRRSVIAGLLAILTYVFYRVAAHNQWIIVTFGRRSFDEGLEPIRTPNEDLLRLLVVGDTGKATAQREQVISAMERLAIAISPDAALLLGDNFYEDGVLSAEDPRFDSDFESLFSPRSFDIPFYAVLGNHDYNGNPEAQVQYSAMSSRWRMPSRYYKQSFSDGKTATDLFVIDTNSLILAGLEAEEQLKWIELELSRSNAIWKIVAGHHPCITGGQHDVAARLIRDIPPILTRYGVNLYLSGHDHDLQLCDSNQGWMQVVSGSASKLRSTSWIDQTLFAEATPGFCTLTVDENSLAISFYNADRHLFTRRIAPTVNVSASL